MNEPAEIQISGHLTGKTVFLVEDEPHLRVDMHQQLSHYGYHVKAFETIEEAKQPAIESIPSAMIVDMQFPEGNTAMAIAEIQQNVKKEIPVLFLSEKGELISRLQAVRFGGDAYFLKPFEINSLIDRLDNLTQDRSVEQYRILIMEHDSALAEDFSKILRDAGMITEILNDPTHVLNVVTDFDPELILMDLYFPECLGMELAAVIRQHESLISIPIVFHSSETNLDRRAAAMRRGGDDHLIRPINPDLLISSVTARVQRSRTLRTLLVQDSLTGLLNHTALRERLGAEVARARRNRQSLSFAMIDIDKFKRVNDMYGHATGDQVIKNLARTLRHRIRPIDFVGRYGGEEFAVILTGADGAWAVDFLNGIREDFSRIRHSSDIEDFYTTFSCGVASFPDYEVATRLNDIADKALYHAKKAGGNRVMRGVREKRKR